MTSRESVSENSVVSRPTHANFSESPVIDFEIIVIDNASAVGSDDAIDAEFGEKFLLIDALENLAFAAGNNRAATTATGEMLLLLNPDTVVLSEEHDHYYAFATQYPQTDIIGRANALWER